MRLKDGLHVASFMFPCTHGLLVAKKGSAVAFLKAHTKTAGGKTFSSRVPLPLREKKRKKKKLFSHVSLRPNVYR